jgi:hypothetical protein
MDLTGLRFFMTLFRKNPADSETLAKCSKVQDPESFDDAAKMPFNPALFSGSIPYLSI